MVAFGEGEQAVLVAEDELVEARQQEWPRLKGLDSVYSCSISPNQAT